MKRTIVALSGWKRSGKDLCAEYLINNYEFIRYAFADALKDSVSKTYNVKREWLDSNQLKEKPLLHYPVKVTDAFVESIVKNIWKELKDKDGNTPYYFLDSPNNCFIYSSDKDDFDRFEEREVFWTPRALAILEGSTKRAVNKDVWVDTIIGKIQDSPLEKFIITDLRYTSEAEKLKEVFNSTPLNEHFNLCLTRIKRFDKVESVDASEHDLDTYKFDHYIDNTDTKEHLYGQLEELMDKLGELPTKQGD